MTCFNSDYLKVQDIYPFKLGHFILPKGTCRSNIPSKQNNLQLLDALTISLSFIENDSCPKSKILSLTPGASFLSKQTYRLDPVQLKVSFNKKSKH